MRILVPVDGSEVSLKAVKHVGSLMRASDAEVRLIHIQPPLPSAVSSFLSEADRRSYHQDQGKEALREAEQLLDRLGVPYESHTAVGSVAETIVDYAREAGCDQIVMGSRGLSPLPNLLMGSTATKVLHLAAVPVTIVK